MLRWIVLAALLVLAVSGLGAAFAPTSTARMTMTPALAASIIPARAEIAVSAARGAAAAANAAASVTTSAGRALSAATPSPRAATAPSPRAATAPSAATSPSPHAATPSPGTASPSSAVAARAAQRAIDAITDRRTSAAAQLAAFPADFAATMGYAPTVATLADGETIAVNPAGGCSVVGGGAPFDLAVPCKAHDLGYDLLRYSHRHGADLPAEARRKVDDRLGTDLDRECAARYQGIDARSCVVMAGSFDAGVGFNSWRQEFEAPVAASGMIRTVGVSLLGLLAVGAAATAATRRYPFRLPRLRAGHRRAAPTFT